MSLTLTNTPVHHRFGLIARKASVKEGGKMTYYLHGRSNNRKRIPELQFYRIQKIQTSHKKADRSFSNLSNCLYYGMCKQ